MLISKIFRKKLIKKNYSKNLYDNFWYKKNLKKKPNFAVLGLNPHNAELRKNS